jgi:hypothetical protein
MPIFKSTYNILLKPDGDELYDRNWMDRNKAVFPPGGPDDSMAKWDYNREMTIDDVDVWEVIFEGGGGWGVYASWCPFAEFYMITTGLDFQNTPKIIDGFIYHHRKFETYYGPGSQQKVVERMKQFQIPFQFNSIWVEQDDMWLHQSIQK